MNLARDCDTFSLSSGEKAGVRAEFSDVVAKNSQKLGFRGSKREIVRGILTSALSLKREGESNSVC